MFKYLFRYYVFNFLILACLISAAGFFYYERYYSMDVVEGSVNVSSSINKNKIYTYSVFNDFYYRVTQFDGNGKRYLYSELVPVQTDLGYDLELNKLSVNTRAGREIPLSESGSENIDPEIIKTMRDFSVDFGTIVSTQNDYYIEQAIERVKEHYNNLWGSELKVETPSFSNLIDSNLKPEIDGIDFNFHNLTYINESAVKIDFLTKDEWQPNIFEYQLPGKAKLYFQYLDNVEDGNIEDKVFDLNDTKYTYIRTIKNFNGNLYKLLIRINTNIGQDKVIETFLQDDNGYVFLLKYRGVNNRALYKILPDFMKIAYGITLSTNTDYSYVDVFNEYHSLINLIEYIKDDEYNLESYCSDENAEVQERLYCKSFIAFMIAYISFFEGVNDFIFLDKGFVTDKLVPPDNVNTSILDKGLGLLNDSLIYFGKAIGGVENENKSETFESKLERFVEEKKSYLEERNFPKWFVDLYTNKYLLSETVFDHEIDFIVLLYDEIYKQYHSYFESLGLAKFSEIKSLPNNFYDLLLDEKMTYIKNNFGTPDNFIYAISKPLEMLYLEMQSYEDGSEETNLLAFCAREGIFIDECMELVN